LTDEHQPSISQHQSVSTERPPVIPKELGEIAESEEIIESSKTSKPLPSKSQDSKIKDYEIKQADINQEIMIENLEESNASTTLRKRG